MKTAASVKALLKNRAQKERRNTQDLFVLYVLERTLYRISISPYAASFTLKGGILLYGVFEGQYVRTTTDVDLLGSHISNDADTIKKAFIEILTISCNDPIRFDLGTLAVKNITEFKKYHGVNISVIAFLDRTRIMTNIDVGFGDAVYPERRKMAYPTILGDEPPILYAYPLESVVAEKFEAVVSLGSVNSRYKDFYDLYTLSEQFDFQGRDLQKAFVQTFDNRKTPLNEIVAFEDGFADDSFRKNRWKGFVKSKRVVVDLTLEEAVARIKKFLIPVVAAIRQDRILDSSWDHKVKDWV